MKPDNFLLGDDKRPTTIFLIDFGLAKPYKDPRTGLHIPYKDSKKLTGTARYASIPTHMGFEQGRRDDLEAICYIMLYFLKGSLPWQGLPAVDKEEKYKKIMEVKLQNTSQMLCQGLPEELCVMVEYFRKLKFEEDPDYAYIYKLIRTVFEKNNFNFDYKYDWTNPRISVTEASSNVVEPLKLLTQGNVREEIKQGGKKQEIFNKVQKKQLAAPTPLIEQ